MELEKILQSGYGDRQLEVFHDYGLLARFLPCLEQGWESGETLYALDLLFERNCRMEEGFFRNSISLAMAVIALPFVEKAMGRAPGSLWEPGRGAEEIVSQVVDQIFLPQNMMVRMREAACRVLNLLPLMEKRENHMLRRIFSSRSYGHARELLFIRLAVAGKSLEECAALWPDTVPERGPRTRKPRGRR